MIAFPSALRGPAEAAGILVPPNTEYYSQEDFPHWHVYVTLQCGRPLPGPSSHWENARIVAQLTEEEIRRATMQDLECMGLQ